MTFASAPAPRYAVLAREIAGEIAGGLHPAGSRLPTEVELSAERGVSRATVRAALMRLEELGLVSRRRRSGTHVTFAGAAQRSSAYVQSLAGVEEYAAETARQVLRVGEVVADDALSRRISVRPGSKWVHIVSLRVPLAGERPPICWTDSYADAASAPANLARQLRSGSFSGLIATLVAECSGRPIDEVVQEIRALSVPAGPIAKALKAVPQEHALEITRRYLDPTGQPLAVTIGLYPAARFSYSTRLRRLSSGRA